MLYGSVNHCLHNDASTLAANRCRTQRETWLAARRCQGAPAPAADEVNQKRWQERFFCISALEVFLNGMRYINPRFTYFTYLLTFSNSSFNQRLKAASTVWSCVLALMKMHVIHCVSSQKRPLCPRLYLWHVVSADFHNVCIYTRQEICNKRIIIDPPCTLLPLQVHSQNSPECTKLHTKFPIFYTWYPNPVLVCLPTDSREEGGREKESLE